MIDEWISRRLDRWKIHHFFKGDGLVFLIDIWIKKLEIFHDELWSIRGVLLQVTTLPAIRPPVGFISTPPVGRCIFLFGKYENTPARIRIRGFRPPNQIRIRVFDKGDSK